MFEYVYIVSLPVVELHAGMWAGAPTLHPGTVLKMFKVASSINDTKFHLLPFLEEIFFPTRKWAKSNICC